MSVNPTWSAGRLPDTDSTASTRSAASHGGAENSHSGHLYRQSVSPQPQTAVALLIPAASCDRCRRNPQPTTDSSLEGSYSGGASHLSLGHGGYGGRIRHHGDDRLASAHSSKGQRNGKHRWRRPLTAQATLSFPSTRKRANLAPGILMST